jgi:cell wall-associated NlpC family hydrolase
MSPALLSRGIVLVVAGCFFTNAVVAQTATKKTRRRHHVPVEDVEPTATPEEESPSPTPVQKENAGKSNVAPDATISPDQIVEYGGELSRVRKLMESALEMTTQDLTYTYSSDDPANGGMDCSGFTAYVLRKNGYPDVPRDASEQYLWVRKAGTFRAVLSRNEETFELDDLRPGDLLFWMGTYATDHDPPITHTMIYLGTEKGSKHRIMVGSSDGRAYHGKSRWGVSVFDFEVGGRGKTNGVMFVGYGRPPGLRD